MLLPPLESNDNVFPACAIPSERALDCIFQAFYVLFDLVDEIIAAVLEEIDQELLHIFISCSIVAEDKRKLMLFKRKLSDNSMKFFIQLLHFLLISQALQGSILDELNRICLLRSNVNFFISGIRLSKADVCLDILVEQHWLLHDISTLLTQ